MSEFRRRMMMVNSGGDIDYSEQYLTFTALESGTFSFVIPTGLSTTDLNHFDYSKNGGSFIAVNNSDSEDVSFTVTVNTGDKIRFKATANRYNNGGDNTSNRLYISSDCTFDISGNILSIIFGDNFINYTSNVDLSNSKYQHLFRSLFESCKINDASNLLMPISKIINYGYYRMFRLSKIVLPPKVIPIISISEYGLFGMFTSCTSLTTMPDISSISNPNFRPFISGLGYMFSACSSLKYFTPIPYVFGGRSGENSSYNNMFKDCVELEESPIQEIRGADNNATTFGGTGSFDSCFSGCRKLKTAPSMPVLTIKNNSYRNMFYYCNQINYIKMLATSKTSSSLTSWVTNVAATGIFVKHINATWTDSGASGVPTGWTVIYYDPSDDKYYTDQTKTTECDDHGNVI